jgi:hypothetical protein
MLGQKLHYLEGQAFFIFRGRLDLFFLSSLFDQNFIKTLSKPIFRVFPEVPGTAYDLPSGSRDLSS